MDPGSVEFRWLLGIVLAAVIAGAAWRARALTGDGALAAVLVGSAVVGGGGWGAGVLLVVFFVTSSILSRLRGSDPGKTGVKGSKRDARQVLANGGVAAILALTAAWADSRNIVPIGIASSIATATSDTWATEIGKFRGRAPRLITNWRRAEPGESGAISGPGTLGGLSGALLIGTCTALTDSLGWWSINQSWTLTIAAVTLGGMTGMMADSLLGATIQARWFCPTCAVSTESRMHDCGTAGLHVSGVRWFDNDVVNLSSIIIGTMVGLLIVVG